MLSAAQLKAFGGTAEQLRAFDINLGPPQDLWVLVDKESGVWFKQVRETPPCVLYTSCASALGGLYCVGRTTSS